MPCTHSLLCAGAEDRGGETRLKSEIALVKHCTASVMVGRFCGFSCQQAETNFQTSSVRPYSGASVGLAGLNPFNILKTATSFRYPLNGAFPVSQN